MSFDFKDKNEYIRILKFGLVGIMNTLVDWVIFFILHTLLGVNELISQPIAYACGIISSFIGNKFFTFKAKNKTTLSETVRFLIVSLIALAVSEGVIWLLSAKLGWNEGIYVYVAKLFATGASLVVNFIGNRFFVFNKAVEKDK